jgi:hypothetical protein
VSQSESLLAHTRVLMLGAKDYSKVNSWLMAG